MCAQTLDIGQQIGSGVVRGRATWRAASATTLVELDDAVACRIKEASMRWRQAAGRSAVQAQHRQALRVARLLDMQDMPIPHGQRVRLPDRGKRRVVNHAPDGTRDTTPHIS
ncbi:hypothetical protein SDC9_181514 [bioreactor metagenome]|uniref:Uncharacterized protein n=1 Tax=bioreactor metagenome TaxID=1076179 RepID=A0A645H6Q0_9ZZZZ